MFGKKSESKPQGRIDSLIGAGTIVEGSVHFTGGLRIDGEVKVASMLPREPRRSHLFSVSMRELKVQWRWLIW
jgi:hypothetical protein